MLTAYDTFSAGITKEIGVDGVLVGDSLGMVLLGEKNTVGVTLTDMQRHSRAVKRVLEEEFVIGDLPFGTYYNSSVAVKNATKLVKYSGVNAVKLEGPMYGEIHAIRRTGIEVMGHLGMTPQTRGIVQSYKRISLHQKDILLEQALRIQDQGCFGVVLECVNAELSKTITDALEIPVIGIGSGVHTDGQISVFHDVMGMYPDKPSFAKQYCDIYSMAVTAGKDYVKEVH